MIDIIAKGFDIRPAHLNMLRAAIGYEDFELFKPDSKLELVLDNKKVYAKWYNEVNNESIEINVDRLDDETTIKLAIYLLFKKINDVNLPWGILTGIRPVRYLEEIIEKYGEDGAEDLFLNYFHVSIDNYKLIKEILNTQKNILKRRRDSYIIYIHIPYCPTRCKYCSFSVINMSGKVRHDVTEYVDYLLKEIDDYNGYMDEKKPISLYIGGGTPSVLNSDDIDRIFAKIREKFGDVREITFEAGRPDTINKNLLDTLKNNKVTRISVNPQSLHQKTLDSIGRLHKVEDFYNAFELCKEYGFDINTDVIIGLSKETQDDVKYTIDELIKLEPDDITIHSLALKNGSYYKINDEEIDLHKDMNSAFEYCNQSLISAGYKPYYMYRQKRQIGDNANIGYTKSSSLNIFNILSMDDKCDVLAFGMGAVSKFTSDDGIVDRVFGFRDIDYYIDHYSELNVLKEKTVQKIKNLFNINN